MLFHKHFVNWSLSTCAVNEYSIKKVFQNNLSGKLRFRKEKENLIINNILSCMINDHHVSNYVYTIGDISGRLNYDNSTAFHYLKQVGYTSKFDANVGEYLLFFTYSIFLSKKFVRYGNIRKST